MRACSDGALEKNLSSALSREQRCAIRAETPRKFSRHRSSRVHYEDIRADDLADESTEKRIVGAPENNRVCPASSSGEM